MIFINTDVKTDVKKTAKVVWIIILAILVVIALIVLKFKLGSADDIVKGTLQGHTSQGRVSASYEDGARPGCGKIILSTTRSVKIDVDSENGWKISYKPTKKVGYQAWFNGGPGVTTYPAIGNPNTRLITTHSKLKYIQFCLTEEVDEEAELVYMKHKGEPPIDWYEIALRETQ